MSTISNFLAFLEQSPSPFHAVESSRKLLHAAGFKELKERSTFQDQIKSNGKYFYTRNQSAIVAFTIGGYYKRGNGFSIIGAHTDSPCLKVRPVSKKEKFGILQVGVELYGGGLWHTWFDRDLSIAGRVMIKTASGHEQRLVRVNKPILRIPNLAIHLSTERDTFTYNKETHLTPVLGLAAEKALNADTLSHHPVLLDLVAKELGIKVDEIRDFELCLYDTQAPAVGGANDEFVFSARLDNLGMSYCALEALIKAESQETDTNIRMIALFDNEEVGSVSTAGADSNLLQVALKRIGEVEVGDAVTSKSAAEEALLKSMLISADMAHGIHPNYSEKHEELHRPLMNAGVVIKQNANQRYATTSVTSLILKEVAKKRGIVLQEFVVRNDSPCGSTIGPMLSAKLGIRTIDVGNPQWSMHSIRETCGTRDVQTAIDLFVSFFEEFAKVEAALVVD